MAAKKDKSRHSDMQYSPSEMEQIGEKLLQYLVENNEKWYNYHTVMQDRIGLKGKERILHDHDPGNWLKESIEPGPDRLNIYSKFVSTVYPDFKFSEGRLNDYISIGRTLARFSVGQVGITESKLSKKAKALNRKIYVSRFSRDHSSENEVYLSSVMCLRSLAHTPFLMCFKFSTKITVDENWIGGPPTWDVDHEDRHRDGQSVVIRSLEHFDGWKIDFPLVNLKRGILCPLTGGDSFHGILKSNDYQPSHVQLIPLYSGNGLAEGIDYKCLGDDAAHGQPFLPAKAHYKQVDKIFSELGEPILW